jgi:outer membrane protein assembly factor BamA
MKKVRSFSSAAIYLLIFLAAGNAEPAAGQSRKYEGRRIATIQFVPYEQPLEAAELKEILPLKIGASLGMADVRAAIDRLFATGRYEDIQVDAQPLGEQVVIRFITRESYFIGHVSVSGDISESILPSELIYSNQMELGC